MTPATAAKKRPAVAEVDDVTDSGIADGLVLELFPDSPDVKAGTKEEIVHLSIAEIEPDPENRPVEADPELTESIRKVGVLTPVTVVPNPDPDKVKAGKPYRLRDGERRYRNSIAAGKTTIRAIVATADAKDTRGHKLLKQWQANWHRKLEPMFEARLIKEVQQETKLSIAQLAKLSGKPKSTIADRLALADAPEAFQELFASGALTAAAAPIIRRFAEIPPKTLEKAADEATQSWEWKQHTREGKPIPLGNVERVLKNIILGTEYSNGLVRELPEKLALLYQGPKITVGEKQYATDIAQFDRAAKKHQDAEDAKAAERAKEDKKSGKRKTAKASTAPALTAAQKKAAEKERKKRQQDEMKKRIADAGWRGGISVIRKAIADAISKAPIGTLVAFVYDHIVGAGAGDIYDLTFDKSESKRAAELVPLGKGAESFVRHVVMGSLEQDFERAVEEPRGQYDNGQRHARSRISQVIKKLGFKINLDDLLGSAELEFKASEKAKEESAKLQASAKPAAKAKKKAKR